MAKTRDSLYYMKLCRRVLQDIYLCPPTEGKRFLMLKKKAAKYLEQAKAAKLLEDTGK